MCVVYHMDNLSDSGIKLGVCNEDGHIHYTPIHDIIIMSIEINGICLLMKSNGMQIYFLIFNINI